MKTKSLTSKQEKFAQLIATGKSQADAYRGAFNAQQMADKTICESASRLMADRNVTARVDYLRAEHMGKVAEEVFYNYEDAMRDLDKAIAFAIECKNPSAWIAALNLKQKISGLHVEERKNDLSPVSGMSAERVKAALEALQALRKAKCNV